MTQISFRRFIVNDFCMCYCEFRGENFKFRVTKEAEWSL